jgi:NhaP-type Na+/H+ or K+/H+ antiporter
MVLLALFITLIFLYTLVSARLELTVLTSPIIFTAAGMAALLLLPELRHWKADHEVFLRVAEAGLVLLLFTDASRTDLRVLRSLLTLPARLLSIGMLLTILLGAVCAVVVFPQFTLWEAGILSAILAPTDAGLGQIIVNSSRVPMRIRQALNVEAGLNDGLSVPFLLFFITLTEAGIEGPRASFVRFIVEQLGYGVAIGLVIGLAAGWLLGLARRREWIAEAFLQLGVVAVPLLCAVASEAAAASMFIAAFVAGLAVQVGYKEAGKHSVEFTEGWGQMLNLAIFMLFGMAVVRDWSSWNLPLVVYAVLSLTVVRMLPVAIALIGTRLSRDTVLFMGWFGPRGLASIVLGMVYLEHAGNEMCGPTIRSAVMVTVLLSIFAHGLSALPGMRLYAAKIATLDPGAPEHQDVGPKTAGCEP